MVFSATVNNISTISTLQNFEVIPECYERKSLHLSIKNVPVNKGNNKITELRTIFQRESQSS